MNDATNFLSLNGVRKTYSGVSSGQFTAIANINLELREHEFVSIIGPSGCGKSTLLRMVAGLESCEEGEIRLQGEKVVGPSSERGLVFQEYALFPWRTVQKNITFGLELKRIAKDQQNATAQQYIELIGLHGFENALPAELSGGMRQRVAIATVLANDPKVLLMDEPFGALDAQTRLTMQIELARVWSKTKKCVLLVTHSVDEAVYLSQRVVVMKAKPGAVQEIVEIELPYPRDLASPEFNELRARLLHTLFGPKQL